MEHDDKALDYLEAQIPELAAIALRAAYWQALASGHSVLVAENGVIYETFPDGTRKFVKAIAAPTPVAVGTKWTLS